MNADLEKRLKNFESLNEKHDYDSARETLKKLSEDYPNEGIVPFYMGKIALKFDEKLALKMFVSAEQMNYESSELYFNIAKLYSTLQSRLVEAEKYFLKAKEVAKNDEELWISLSALAEFYITNKMFLKAEKTIKIFAQKYPQDYQSHHLHILIETLKNNFEESLNYLNNLPESFQRHPQLLLDMIDLYKIQKKYDELGKILEEDKRFKEIIPNVVLKEKFNVLENDEEHRPEKKQILEELAKKYHDGDAVFALMLLYFCEGDYKKSYALSKIIIENEQDDLNFRLCTALYYKMYNIYMISEGKSTEAEKAEIKNSGIICKKCIELLGIDEVTEEVNKNIKSLLELVNN